MLSGRTRSNRRSRCKVLCKGWVLYSLDSLKSVRVGYLFPNHSLEYRVSGEGSYSLCDHQRGLGISFPVILEKRGIYYVISDIYRRKSSYGRSYQRVVNHIKYMCYA